MPASHFTHAGHPCLSDRQIALSVDAARSTVRECLQRAQAAGIGWPLPEGMNDAQLEAQLYPTKPAVPVLVLPDFAHVHREMQRAGVTRDLLWREYRAQHPDGLGYTAFCVRYRGWLASADPVMRFEHRAGDKLFVDYAGHTIPIIDRHSGEIHRAQIFVAVLGCSNYTFAEATLTQSLPDWLGSHVRALQFIGGAPAAVVPDNLRSAVTRAHRYDPQINPAYAEFAEHYALAIWPARVRRPRDNAFAERFVRSIKSECLNRMIFFGQASLQHAISHFMAHYQTERNHQGLENRLVQPGPTIAPSRLVHRRQRLGGMLNYYHRAAA